MREPYGRLPRTSAVFEVAQDGEDAAVVGLGRLEAELGEDVRYVLLDGALSDDEALRDPGVRKTLGHQREDLALARGEPVVRVSPGTGEQLGDHLRVERRPPAG